MTFHVMDNPSPYNAILGREWLHIMGKVPFAEKILPRYPGVKSNSERSNTRETEELMLRRMVLINER